MISQDIVFDQQPDQLAGGRGRGGSRAWNMTTPKQFRRALVGLSPEMNSAWDAVVRATAAIRIGRRANTIVRNMDGRPLVNSDDDRYQRRVTVVA
jgi:hypothetical protein